MKSEEQAIRDLTLEWLGCWHIEDDKPWAAERFRHLQVEDEVLVIDDYGGKLYVFCGNEGYKTVWGPLVEQYMRQPTRTSIPIIARSTTPEYSRFRHRRGRPTIRNSMGSRCPRR